MDYLKVSNIQFDNVDMKDFPDFSDAYIQSADYDGVYMSDEQLEELNGNAEFIHEQLFNTIF